MTLLEIAENAPAEIKENFLYRAYKKDTEILSYNKSSLSLQIVVSGTIEVYKMSYSGSKVTVNTFEKGDFFGEIELFCPDLKPYNVSSRTDSSVIVIAKEDVFNWMQKDFAFTKYLYQILTRRLYLTSNLMSRIVLLPLKERVAGTIFSYYEDGILSSLNKRTLVFQVGAPIRSVNRVVKECIKEGLIEYKDQSFKVSDEKALSMYSLTYEI